MITSRKLSDLHPTVKSMAERFIARCKKTGIDILVTCTYRDNEAQDALYARGRTAPGAKVTKVKGGDSFHNHRVALDFVPLRFGKPVWGTTGNGIDNDPTDDEKDDLELWQRAGAIAESCGFEWGGRWKKFRDLPHLQYTGGLKTSDFNAGKTLQS